MLLEFYNRGDEGGGGGWTLRVVEEHEATTSVLEMIPTCCLLAFGALRPFSMEDRNDCKKQKQKKKKIRGEICRAMGPKTRKFRPTYRNCDFLWEAVFLCPPTEVRLISEGGLTSLVGHKNK